MSASAVKGKRKTAARKQAKKPVAARAKKQTASRLAAAAKKGKSAEKAMAAPAEIAHRLHLLLHSLHQIERYEERLCQMQDAIKRTGRIGAPLLRDLQTLLDEIPSDDFQHDLDAVRSAVAA